MDDVPDVVKSSLTNVDKIDQMNEDMIDREVVSTTAGRPSTIVDVGLHCACLNHDSVFTWLLSLVCFISLWGIGTCNKPARI